MKMNAIQFDVYELNSTKMLKMLKVMKKDVK